MAFSSLLLDLLSEVQLVISKEEDEEDEEDEEEEEKETKERIEKGE